MKSAGDSRTILNRREAMKLAGASALASILPFHTVRAAQRLIKIGFVTPATGPLAAAGEVDDFILKGVREALKNGVANPAGNTPVEILVKDSQSNPNRAAEVAGELILQDNIDLMVVGATPDNTNPVCDQCELNGVPCISTTHALAALVLRPRRRSGQGLPVDLSLLLGYRGHPRGLHQHLEPGPKPTRRSAFSSPTTATATPGAIPSSACPRRSTKMGYTVFDPGRFQPLQQDFSARSPHSRRRTSRSSPACRSRRTSRTSGPRRASRASVRRS